MQYSRPESILAQLNSGMRRAQLRRQLRGPTKKWEQGQGPEQPLALAPAAVEAVRVQSTRAQTEVQVVKVQAQV